MITAIAPLVILYAIGVHKSIIFIRHSNRGATQIHQASNVLGRPMKFTQDISRTVMGSSFPHRGARDIPLSGNVLIGCTPLNKIPMMAASILANVLRSVSRGAKYRRDSPIGNRVYPISGDTTTDYQENIEDQHQNDHYSDDDYIRKGLSWKKFRGFPALETLLIYRSPLFCLNACSLFFLNLNFCLYALFLGFHRCDYSNKKENSGDYI